MMIDLNSIISTAILGMTTWTLYTVHGLAKRDAAREEHDARQDSDIDEVKTRLTSCEEGLGEVRVKVAYMEGHE